MRRPHQGPHIDLLQHGTLKYPEWFIDFLIDGHSFWLAQDWIAKRTKRSMINCLTTTRQWRHKKNRKCSSRWTTWAQYVTVSFYSLLVLKLFLFFAFSTVIRNCVCHIIKIYLFTHLKLPMVLLKNTLSSSVFWSMILLVLISSAFYYSFHWTQWIKYPLSFWNITLMTSQCQQHKWHRGSSTRVTMPTHDNNAELTSNQWQHREQRLYVSSIQLTTTKQGQIEQREQCTRILTMSARNSLISRSKLLILDSLSSMIERSCSTTLLSCCCLTLSVCLVCCASSDLSWIFLPDSSKACFNWDCCF